MRQVLFRIPGLGLTAYGFATMAVLAVLAGWLAALRRARRAGLDPDLIHDLAACLTVGGLVGARAFYVGEYWGETVTSAAQALRVWEGGLALYGGAIGGAIAFALYRAWRPFPALKTLDALAPSLALGVAIGRLGCFLNGCCYGKACPFPGLGVRFPGHSPAWASEQARGLIGPSAAATLPLHPTQLYAALDALLLFLLLSAYYPVRRRDGSVLALLMVAYPISRFFLDFLRDDEAMLASGLTVAQAASLMLLAGALLFWTRLAARPADRA